MGKKNTIYLIILVISIFIILGVLISAFLSVLSIDRYNYGFYGDFTKRYPNKEYYPTLFRTLIVHSLVCFPFLIIGSITAYMNYIRKKKK